MQNTFQTVSQDLLHANQLSADELAKSLAIIGNHHVDYADIYCQRTAFESWHLDEGMVKSGSFQIDQGVGVRAVLGEKTAFAYADSLTADAIQRAAQTRKSDWRGRQYCACVCANACLRQGSSRLRQSDYHVAIA